MSSYETTCTLPVSVAAVVPAGALAAIAVGKGVREQLPASLVCKGSWLRVFGNPVTLRLRVAGTDGAAMVQISGSNFGFGPINTGVCRNEVEAFRDQLLAILGQPPAGADSQAPNPVTPEA
jgi:hypothetical protein